MAKPTTCFGTLLLRGKFGRFYGEVGMPWFWSKIQTRFASREGMLAKEVLGYPTGSFDVVFDTLADKIRGLGGQIRIENPRHKDRAAKRIWQRSESNLYMKDESKR